MSAQRQAEPRPPGMAWTAPLPAPPGTRRWAATRDGEALDVLVAPGDDDTSARARTLARLMDPGVVPVVEVGRLSDGSVYLACPARAVPTLEAGEAPADALPRLGREVNAALAALHEAGLWLGGALERREVWLGEATLLDVRRAALVEGTPVPAEDVRALAGLLRELDGRLFDSLFRRLVAERDSLTATLLDGALKLMAEPPDADTAVSSSGPRARLAAGELVGHQLGPWKLESLLGEGAMGRVYLARHERIGRRAAVKVLKAHHAANTELVQRFIQEAQAVNAIRDEHIVEVYDFGEELQPDGATRVYCVMELLEGRSLADALGEPFPVARVARVGRQLAEALHAAHLVGVVHRDVKPENIYLARRGAAEDFVKVLDFGVAKLMRPLGDLPTGGTQAGIIIGTPEYMAPEQALGNPTDARIDIYAAGLVLYELLTGRQPFHADSFGKLVVQIASSPVPPLGARAASGEVLPEGLAEVVLRCLEKDPLARFPTAAHLAQALAPYESAEAASATAAARWPTLPPQALEVPPGPPIGWRGLAVPGVALALLLAVAAVGALWSRPRPAEASASSEAPAAKGVEPAPAPPPVEAPRKVELGVDSRPAGAEVFRLDTGASLGRTPLQVALPPVPSLALELRLAGHQVAARTVSLQRDLSVQVDLTPLVKEDATPRPRPAAPAGKVKDSDAVVDPFR